MSEIGKRRLALIHENAKIRRQAVWVQYISGASTKQLADKYKVTRSQIYNLIGHAEKDQQETKV